MSHKPQGHNAVSPYLLVSSVAQMLSFLQATFAAEVLYQAAAEDGVVRHAEVRIDDSVIMMGERSSDSAAVQCSTHVYVADVDAAYQRALSAGASTVSAPRDQPYGERTAGVRDGEGNLWWIGTHLR